MEKIMNVAKKRYTPYDIARNICGVKRAMTNANSLVQMNNASAWIWANTSKRTGMHQLDDATNACDAGRTCCGNNSAATTHGVPVRARKRMGQHEAAGRQRTDLPFQVGP